MWTTRGPSAWPLPPNRMSYTALRSIETCPLRWGLRQGAYPDVWAGTGYPPSHSIGTTAGHVVHVAVEQIVRSVGAEKEGQLGGRSLGARDPMLTVVEALRALGGISAVLEGVITETVESWKSNPRLSPRVEELTSHLQRQLPALRPRVQHFLNLVDLSRIRPARSSNRAVAGGNAQESAVRPLPPGLFAEVPLVHDDLGWYGKADLLRVSAANDTPDDSEIVDLKTGIPKPDHALQLRIYALLWARDKRRNPAGRPAQRLTVLYDSGPVQVAAPTTSEELDEVEQELAARTREARAAIQRHPPEARPSRDACEWCDVRHMCPAYWVPTTRGSIAPSHEAPRKQVDAALQILNKQGAWSWVARVEEVGALSDHIALGARVLVRARMHDVHFGSLFAVGTRFRIIAAQFVAETEESGGLPVLSLTRATEAFVIDDGSGVRGRGA
jgi:hypothetical protein